MIRALHAIIRGAAAVSGALVFFLMFASVFEAVARRLGRPTAWVFDYNTIALLGMVVLGLAAAQRDGEHIAVQFVVDRLPPRAKRGLAILNQLLTLFLLSVLAVFGASIARASWQAGRTVGGLTRTPAYLVQALFVAGIVLILLEVVVEFVTGRPQKQALEQPDERG
jgi:TRAP-type C4-dicarboxylate transport system permease small subunit